NLVKKITDHRLCSTSSHHKFMNPFQKHCKQKGWLNKKAVEQYVHRLLLKKATWILSTGGPAQPVLIPSGYRNTPLSFSTPRLNLITPRSRPPFNRSAFHMARPCRR